MKNYLTNKQPKYDLNMIHILPKICKNHKNKGKIVIFRVLVTFSHKNPKFTKNMSKVMDHEQTRRGRDLLSKVTQE